MNEWQTVDMAPTGGDGGVSECPELMRKKRQCVHVRSTSFMCCYLLCTARTYQGTTVARSMSCSCFLWPSLVCVCFWLQIAAAVAEVNLTILVDELVDSVILDEHSEPSVCSVVTDVFLDELQQLDENQEVCEWHRQPIDVKLIICGGTVC